MTSRERVARAITFGTPDRLPVAHSFTPAARRRYADEIAALAERFPPDIAPCGARSLDIDRTQPGIHTDKWGVVWRNEAPGLIGMAVEHPLDDWARRCDYCFPDPTGLFDWTDVPKAVAENRGEKFLVGTGQWLWQRMFWLRGFQNILTDIAEEREEVLWLRDNVLRVQKGVLEIVVRFDIDGVWFLDDWGSQANLLIRPAAWRAIFKDAYRELFAMAHSAGKKVLFHTDGNVADIVPDLQEIGADVLNLEVPVMARDALDRCVRGTTCVLGGLDLQHVLAENDADAVLDHVDDLVRRFATSRGGYIGQIVMDGSTTIGSARCVAERLAAT